MTFAQLATNRAEQSLAIIKRNLQDAKVSKIAVAYVKRSGLQLIRRELKRSLRQKNDVRLLVGLGFGTTDKEALVELERLESKHPNLKCRVFAGGDYDLSEFHPKLFYFGYNNEAHLLIGSSNLTSGGLCHNFEAMVALQDSKDSTLMSEVTSYFDYLWQQGKDLTKPILAAYEPMTRYYRESQLRSSSRWRKVRSEIGKAEYDVRNVRPLARALVPSILSSSNPMSTPEIYEYVKRKIPNLCNDTPGHIRCN